MCLIIARDTRTPTQKGFPFSAVWGHNHDGFGIAISDGKRLTVHKTMRRARAQDLLTTALAGDKPFIAHFRFRTRGKRNIGNVHPFRLGRHKVMYAHNGTLETDEGAHGESDSVMFGRSVLTPLTDIVGPDALFDHRSKIAKVIAFMTTGSRLAFINTRGEVTTYGEGWTHWRELKCSNGYSLIEPRVSTDKSVVPYFPRGNYVPPAYDPTDDTSADIRDITDYFNAPYRLK